MCLEKPTDLEATCKSLLRGRRQGAPSRSPENFEDKAEPLFTIAIDKLKFLFVSRNVPCHNHATTKVVKESESMQANIPRRMNNAKSFRPTALAKEVETGKGSSLITGKNHRTLDWRLGC